MALDFFQQLGRRLELDRNNRIERGEYPDVTLSDESWISKLWPKAEGETARQRKKHEYD